MITKEDYRVRLEVFEGPLDLLLYLIKKEEVDIYDIPIVKITNQYIEYLALMEMLDLDIASDFVVMASTLLYIKSRMLLPAEERPIAELEEQEDPRMELVRQLLEYKQFKEAAGYLSIRSAAEENIFSRLSPAVPVLSESKPLIRVEMFDLLNAFSTVLKRMGKDEVQEMFEEQHTVPEKISSIRTMLEQTSSFSFTGIFTRLSSRIEAVVTFLAMLELIRLGEIGIQQKEQFGEIFIVKR